VQKVNTTYNKSEKWANELFLQFEIIRQNSSWSNIEIVNELLKILSAKVFYDANVGKYSETDFYQLFEQIKTDNIGFFQAHKRINLQSNFLENVLNTIHFFDEKFDFEITGNGFEFFIENVFKNNLGQFYTPLSLIKYMVEIIDPKDGETIYDPCCGTGGFLTYAKQLQAKANIYGNDVSNFMVRVTKLNLKLHGFSDETITQNESLKISEPIDNQLFDIVFANPPFGNIKEKNSLFDVSKSTSRIEIYFLEKCLKSLKPGGRMAIILPTFNLGSEGLNDVRNYIESQAKLINITGLPREIFFKIGASGISSSILFLKKFTIEESHAYENAKAGAVLKIKEQNILAAKKEIFIKTELRKLFDYQIFVSLLEADKNSFDTDFDEKFKAISHQFQLFETTTNAWGTQKNKINYETTPKQKRQVAEPKGIYE